MKTRVTINNRYIETVVDSGAAISIITDKLRKELKLPITDKSNITCTLANGGRIASLGKTGTEIIIGGIIVPIVLDVIESKQKEIIIGNDSLDEWNAVINYKDKTLELDDNEEIVIIPVWYFKKRDENEEYESESETEDEIEESEYESEDKKKLYTMKETNRKENLSENEDSDESISDSDIEDTDESEIEDE